MKKGFYLKKLLIKGPNVPDTEISFEKGTNLVSGPSQSGKSYIFSALSYTLGRTQAPKRIKESKGYNSFFLEIRPFEDDKPYTLKRKLDDFEIFVKECKADDFESSEVNQVGYRSNSTINENHIAHFLLSFCGLEEKKLLKSVEKNTTENLSISTLRKFTFIPEDKIIKNESPFYFSDNYTNYTRDKSLLSVILSGEDFSDIEKKDKED
ncbi:MAG: AAA family ATPase, partial [Christiangramia sp.]|nr:AAA family ATPase [Christiangramia sp.]